MIYTVASNDPMFIRFAELLAIEHARIRKPDDPSPALAAAEALIREQCAKPVVVLTHRFDPISRTWSMDRSM